MTSSTQALFPRLFGLLERRFALLRDRFGRSPTANSGINVSQRLLLGGLLFLCALGSVAQSTPDTPGAKSTPLQILILSGDQKPDSHDITAELRQLLLDCGRFEVRICESPAGLSAQTLSPFDAVVDDCQQSSLDEDTKKALEEFVRSGRGLVVTRSGLTFVSSAATRGSASHELSRLINLSGSTNRNTTTEASFHRFVLKNVLPKHPVMAALTDFRTADQPL